MRVLVCGGRYFDDVPRSVEVLDHYRREAGDFEVVIHGTASGADYLADCLAKLRCVPILPFPAEWENLAAVPCVTRTRRDGTKYNVLAGSNRNTRMLREGKPDLVIAFPGGTGTADMIRKARMAKVPVVEVPSC